MKLFLDTDRKGKKTVIILLVIVSGSCLFILDLLVQKLFEIKLADFFFYLIQDFTQDSDLSLSPGTNLHHGARHGAADGKALEHSTN